MRRRSNQKAKQRAMFHKKKVYHVTTAPLNSDSTENIISKTESPKEDGCKRSKCSINYKTFLGLFYTIITSVFITLTCVFVKQLAYISPGELSMVRNIGVWTGCLPIAIYSVQEVFGKKKERPMLIARGFLVATALYLNLTAFRYLPLAQAAIIMSTTPAVTTVMARIYLKEPCGLVQGLALVITGAGVTLSVRLPELIKESKDSELDSNYIFGICSAVGCVLILSVSYVSLRKMKDIHFSVSLVYTGLIGMVENGIINISSSYFSAPRCGWDQILVILIGVFGFFGHCTLTLAIQVEAVSIVSVMKASSDIIVALIFQVLFFNVIPDVYNLSGAFLVIVSLSIIGLKKWIATLPGASKTRKKLKFLLL